MNPLVTISTIRDGDPPKGKVTNPPPPLLSGATKAGLLYVMEPPDHPCYHQYISFFNRDGLELEDGDVVEFETGFLAVDPDDANQRIYFADIKALVPADKAA
jgi:hypothetical protein